MAGPVPCSHCGFNFMPRETIPGALRLCNNCQVKETTRKNAEDNKAKMAKILIECPIEVQKRLEEKCLNSGESLSAIFLRLIMPELNMQTEEIPQKEEYIPIKKTYGRPKKS